MIRRGRPVLMRHGLTDVLGRFFGGRLVGLNTGRGGIIWVDCIDCSSELLDSSEFITTDSCL